MATTMEIVQGISQIMANSYDGALDSEGQPIKVGLKREEGHFINDRRVMDGFNVTFHGPLLRIKYQSDVRIKEVQDKGFEDDIVGRLAEIVKFLKKEYKAITGDTLTLTKEGEPKVLVQRMSNYRTDVQAHCDYRIGGLTDVVEVNEGSNEDRLDKAIRDWLSLGPKGRPKNDTRKGS